MSEVMRMELEDFYIDQADAGELSGLTEHQQKLLKNQQRVDTLLGIVNVYKDESEVQIALEALKVRPAEFAVGKDGVGQYLDYIGQYDVTTPDEIKGYYAVIDTAVDRFKDVEDITDVSPDDRQLLIDTAIARQAVYIGNQRLVVSIAKTYPHGKGLDLLEIIQEGNYGLARSIALFEVSRGHKFSTYATLWINQSIRHAYADMGSLIRLPGHAHDKWLAIQRLQREMSVELERQPTVEELCKRGKIAADKLLHLMRVAKYPLSMNAAVSSESDETLGDFLSDQAHDDESVVDDISNKQLVGRLMNGDALTDREKLVIALRYGLFAAIPENLTIWSQDSGEPIDYQSRIKEEMRAQIHQQMKVESPTSELVGMKLNHIGSIIGTSTERVRQIQTIASKKAKLYLEELEAS